MLTINGKPIPGTEGIQIKNMYFSPDGKHFAAHCKTKTYTEFILLDGKKGQEYQSIDDMRSPPTFTADSSKLVYNAQNAGRFFVIVNDDESDGIELLTTAPILGGNARVAYGTTEDNGRRSDVVVDGKKLAPSRTRGLETFTFSPDGARYAFVCGAVGSGNLALVVDGVDTPGISVDKIAARSEVNINDLYYVFSPDGKHLVYLAKDLRNDKRRGLWVDQKLFFPIVPSMIHLNFTPDSQHLLWTAYKADEPGKEGTKWNHTLYIDGQPSVKYPLSGFDSMPGSREINSDGVLTFLAVEDGAIKRYRVTPSSDTSIANLLGGTNPVTDLPKTDTMKAASDTNVSPTQPRNATERGGPVAVASSKPLTWADLVNHPERWPAETKLTVQLKFDGDVLRAGTVVGINQVTAKGIQLVAPQGFAFTADPAECDLLQAANALWATLTPAQRELTYSSLFQRKELWPYRLTLNRTFDLNGGGTWRPGDQVVLMGVQHGELLVVAEKLNTALNVKPQETDLLAQARNFLEEKNGPPSRMAEELEGKLTNPVTGEPAPLDTNAMPRYYVIYNAGGWCPFSREFTPKLLQFYADMKPKHPEAEVIYIAADKSVADMRKYAKDAGFSWRTVSCDRTKDLRLLTLGGVLGHAMPQIVVMDRYGNVLIDTLVADRTVVLKQLEALLKQPQAQK